MPIRHITVFDITPLAISLDWQFHCHAMPPFIAAEFRCADYATLPSAITDIISTHCFQRWYAAAAAFMSRHAFEIDADYFARAACFHWFLRVFALFLRFSSAFFDFIIRYFLLPRRYIIFFFHWCFSFSLLLRRQTLHTTFSDIELYYISSLIIFSLYFRAFELQRYIRMSFEWIRASFSSRLSLQKRGNEYSFFLQERTEMRRDTDETAFSREQRQERASLSSSSSILYSFLWEIAAQKGTFSIQLSSFLCMMAAEKEWER